MKFLVRIALLLAINVIRKFRQSCFKQNAFRGTIFNKINFPCKLGRFTVIS